MDKVSAMLSQASEKFKSFTETNSVVGDPIVTPDGTMIIPISKISFGFGGGGSEFDSKKSDTDTRFGGGMGGGATIQAEAFLVVNDGNVRLIPMGSGGSPVDKIIDMVPGAMDKVNGFIAGIGEKRAKKNNKAVKTTGE